jgi:hypothetical protein
VTIRQESVDTFIATAPINDGFRQFAFDESPVLVPLDNNDRQNIVILSNAVDTAAVYRRMVGPTKAWLQYVEFLPSCPSSEAADTVNQMAAWMFGHRSADTVFAAVRPGNEKAKAFSEASGAVLVLETKDRCIFEISRQMH